MVALLDRDDSHRTRCQKALRAISEELVTVWPAVTEAMYILGTVRGGARAQDALWDLLQAGAPRLLPLDENDFPRMRELMEKYRDLPMDLADAALVRMAERERIETVFTVDKTDFGTYRYDRTRRFRILP